MGRGPEGWHKTTALLAGLFPSSCMKEALVKSRHKECCYTAFLIISQWNQISKQQLAHQAEASSAQREMRTKITVRELFKHPKKYIQWTVCFKKRKKERKQKRNKWAFFNVLNVFLYFAQLLNWVQRRYCYKQLSCSFSSPLTHQTAINKEFPHTPQFFLIFKTFHIPLCILSHSDAPKWPLLPNVARAFVHKHILTEVH